MTAILSRDNVFASPQRFDWGSVDNLGDLVTVPELSIEDLEQLSMTPDDLRESGHDVPMADDEALRYASDAFRQTVGYEEWAAGFLPQMAVLWPCQMAVRPEAAVEAIRREGLACTLVKGQINGTEVSGIALTGGGMDLSDHIAAAYMLCGQLPPVTVIESALRIGSPKMEMELVEAAALAADLLDASSSSIRALVDHRLPVRRP